MRTRLISIVVLWWLICNELMSRCKCDLLMKDRLFSMNARSASISSQSIIKLCKYGIIHTVDELDWMAVMLDVVVYSLS